MKKIYLMLAIVASVLTSCDMDKMPEGVLDDQTGLNTFNKLTNDRNYTVYSGLRGRTSGSWVYNTELQMDQFVGVQGNGNRGGTFSLAQVTAGDGTMGTIYGSLYSAIANANYFIENAQKEHIDLTDEQKADVALYIGEAKFARAFYYFYLLDHFCPTINASNADVEGKGLQLVDKYNPTGNTETYPGRSSLRASIDFINTDLSEAYTAIKAYETSGPGLDMSPNSAYLNSSVVRALQARVAIATGDNENAIIYAREVISNTNYSLATPDEYIQMWNEDVSPEVIFKPFAAASEQDAISSIGEGWNYWWSDANQSDYIPTYSTLAAYGNGDIRFDAFFTVHRIKGPDNMTAQTYVFNKFPGNPELISGTNRYKNGPKPFRLSEQYLILAEAAANLNQTDVANNALKTLREARIEGYTHRSLSGNALIEAVREERGKELLGEGFRMSDLRRWGVGFTRDESYPILPALAGWFLGAEIQYAPNDYRYVWPIPTSEMEITPALKGQQNEGY